MMRNVLTFLLSILFFLSAIAQNDSISTDSTAVTETANSSETKRVYKFDVKEEIGPGIWRKMQKAFDEAEEWNADLILIHMNTYGGMVIHADSMRTKILNNEIPVWVFIDNNAASAGALISIACDSIYMRKGANIGAG